MAAEPESRPRFRRLTLGDRAEAVVIAEAAFAGNGFYESSLGFDAGAFRRYWELFTDLALRDPAARVLGVEVDGSLAAVLVLAYRGFPGRVRGARFLVSLLRGIGLRRTLTYLRFVSDYERAMHRRPRDAAREARGLWLMAGAGVSRPGVGAALARYTVSFAGEEGRNLCTGFVDAGNAPLLHFYRRAGFRIGPRFPFHGGWAVVVERDSGRPS